MTALDIIVLLLAGGLGIGGVRKGFVHESLSLAAWVAGFLAVRLFHEPVSDWLAEPVGTEGGASVLSAAAVFGIVFAAGKLIASRLGTAARGSSLGAFDRILGGGFGAFKGVLAASLAFLLVSLGYDTIYGGAAERPEWMTDSRTYPLLNATARALVDYASERQRGGGVGDGNSV